MARLDIHHTQCANGVVVVAAQECARVKALVGFARYHRVIHKAGVFQRIGHNENIWLEQRMGAKSNIPRCFGKADTDPRFEPLAVFIYKTDDRHGCFAQLGGQLGNVVERLFGVAVQNFVAAQSL